MAKKSTRSKSQQVADSPDPTLAQFTLAVANEIGNCGPYVASMTTPVPLPFQAFAFVVLLDEQEGKVHAAYAIQRPQGLIGDVVVYGARDARKALGTRVDTLGDVTLTVTVAAEYEDFAMYKQIDPIEQFGDLLANIEQRLHAIQSQDPGRHVSDVSMFPVEEVEPAKKSTLKVAQVEPEPDPEDSIDQPEEIEGEEDDIDADLDAFGESMIDVEGLAEDTDQDSESADDDSQDEDDESWTEDSSDDDYIELAEGDELPEFDEDGNPIEYEYEYVGEDDDDSEESDDDEQDDDVEDEPDAQPADEETLSPPSAHSVEGYQTDPVILPADDEEEDEDLAKLLADVAAIKAALPAKKQQLIDNVEKQLASSSLEAVRSYAMTMGIPSIVCEKAKTPSTLIMRIIKAASER